MKRYALIVAGGSGSRMGSALPKQFLEVGGIPILMRTIDAFANMKDVPEIILALPENQIDFWRELIEKHNFQTSHTVVKGGASRFQSVKNGLDKLQGGGLVAVHDGVRPFTPANVLDEAYKTAEKTGSAVVAVELKDSIREIDGDGNSEAKDRAQYRLVQTPQVFGLKNLKDAYAQPEQSRFTDDASVFEAFGGKITLTQGAYENIKITTPEDMVFAEAFVKSL
ncbi:2-C-methyl-D-erythritol 4-phosphate cytidylyltransferase [Fulvitalea axinellae]|uniref:2-C-methyl-D-erythritol 4-phosphate cytidylyltransferase n=1 Tax=Fulvitalea axinellae TaxID=1182444 RepID=A0AAU9CEZ4_9BACT|nr:2-C-methyl-D-erythritol 4-phosphate cytidylyltransferase [Fulvitalea axinellae]